MTAQLTNKPPEITESTREERRVFIKNRYPCIADCDMCGICKVFRVMDPEEAYRDYINGIRSFMDVSGDHKSKSSYSKSITNISRAA